MKLDLSIIMPCYNCEATLREAVESCYTQGLEANGILFELILVDDGSTDGTRTLIKKMATGHSNLSFIFHKTNMGGGAARNTAVAASQGNFIFCLDSDDILPPITLIRMIECIHNKKSDGVIFSGAYSFSTNKENYTKRNYSLPLDQPIGINNFFAEKHWVGENFLYTRGAFDMAGGYPTDHPFDTQGYGFRFLALGLKAYPCPDTFFYHRQFGDNQSYFERAYTSGEFSVGLYLIFREYINIFSKKVQNIILDYEIFKKNSLETNIVKELIARYKNNPSDFFSNDTTNPDPRNMLNPEYLYQRGKFEEAFTLFTKKKEFYTNADFDLIRYTYAAKNNDKMSLEIYKKISTSRPIIAHKQNPFRLSFLQRVQRKIKKILSKQS